VILAVRKGTGPRPLPFHSGRIVAAPRQGVESDSLGIMLAAAGPGGPDNIVGDAVTARYHVPIYLSIVSYVLTQYGQRIVITHKLACLPLSTCQPD